MKRTYLIGLSILSLAFSVLHAEEAKPQRDYKEEALSLIIDKARQYSEAGEMAVGKAIDLAQQEAPEVIKEYLTWKFIEAAWIPACMLFVAACLAGVFFYCFKQEYKYDGHHISMVFSVTFGIMALIVFACNIMKPVQIAVAPRVYLMDQVISVLKK